MVAQDSVATSLSQYGMIDARSLPLANWEYAEDGIKRYMGDMSGGTLVKRIAGHFRSPERRFAREDQDHVLVALEVSGHGVLLLSDRGISLFTTEELYG